MTKSIKTKKVLILCGFFFFSFFAYKIFIADSHGNDVLSFQNNPKLIYINDNGLIYSIEASANTIKDALDEKNIKLADHDRITPSSDSAIYPGMQLNIDRAAKIKIQVDGKALENYSAEKTIGGVLDENHVSLGRLDKVLPEIGSRPQPNSTVIVTRINIEEKTVTEDIDFKTTYKEDPKLSWREEKIEQAGQKGTRELKYKITYKNSKEASRVILEKNITKDPVPAIIVKGTYVQLGKASKGDASFYASSWGELNASRSIPRGGFAKVTNLDNGKSVIVKINDYGPQSPQRIIDLSYASFSKIGSLGQGILHNVKVERILN